MLAFRFDEVRGARTTYSYNVPRDRFDASVARGDGRARAPVPKHARIERAGEGERFGSRKPASMPRSHASPTSSSTRGGRGRQLARLLDLPLVHGDRRDTALHAHLEGVALINPNDIHTDRLEHGWSWRIPLPGRVSVGLVMDPAALREFGGDVEEQFDGYLRHDPQLSDWGVTAKRISPVMKYTNYQLRHTRGLGPGWALVGDAFGFIDPVFSSGLLIALDGAWNLAQALISGSDRALRRFESRNLKQLENWQRIVRYFYDGRLFTLFKIGEEMSTRGSADDRLPPPPHAARRHGRGDHPSRSMGLLDFMVQYAL